MVARQWTDDWAKCWNACVGQYLNRTPNENNLCFHFQLEDFCLYGVFEPHNGVEAAKTLLQRMAAEILFQPLAKFSDEEIRDMLRNAFVTVEKAYVENYDGMIAERTSLQYQLQTLKDTEISNDSGRIISRLKEIDQHLSGGATVVIALVHANKLFVANVGETRALLCRTDVNSVLRVVQLSVDHSLNNEDELLRLSQLGLDVNKLRNAQYLGNQSGTRCLGNFLVKGLYKAFPAIANATNEPVIAAPEIHGPILLDSTYRFLVLVSAGVHKRVQKMHGCSEQTNKQLAQVIVENFRKETEFNNLSQSVLKEIDEDFNAFCQQNKLNPKSNTYMTLLIRNFNFPLPNDPIFVPQEICRLKSNKQTNVVEFNPVVMAKTNTNTDIELDYSNTIDTQLNTNRTDSSELYSNAQLNNSNRKIKGYVDFTCYYENVEKARKEGTLPSFLQ